MSEMPVTGYNTEGPGEGWSPPYGMQPGYPMTQPGYPQPGYPQPGYPQPVMAQPIGQQQTNTTIVVTQPSLVVQQQRMRDWSTGLCGCFEDCYSCK